ncbi:hypothetical protein V7794_07695 [Rhizobium laguerreae]
MSIAIRLPESSGRFKYRAPRRHHALRHPRPGGALTLADRIVIMRDGCTEQIAPPITIYRQPQTAFVVGFMGSVPAEGEMTP